MIIFAIIFLIIVAVVFERFYLRPKAELKRYKTIFKSLGYKVYEQPFAFLGLSFAKDWERGKRLHNDVQYFEARVFSEVDVCIGNILSEVMIYFINPDLIREFLSADNIGKYQKLGAVSGVKVAVGEGIVFSEGEAWKNKRKLMSKVFNFQLLKENIPKIIQICDKYFQIYEQRNQIGNGKYKYDILKVSARMFNGVMMKCFFGSNQIQEKINGMDYEQFVVKTIAQTAELTLNPIFMLFGRFLWRFPLSSSIRKAKESIRLLRAKTSETLRSRMEEVKNSPISDRYTDIIQALVSQKMANKQEFTYSDPDLIDEFQTFLIAGTDTTSHFFAMMVYYTAKYPQVHKKLREQIFSIIKADQDITLENLKKLTYIDWIQNQTTRFYGPVNGIFPRFAVEDNFLCGIPINKGTIVTIQPKGNHFKEQYFKDPYEFRPQRWENQCDSIHPYAFVGFSAGPRSCLGKQLAHLQSKVALVLLVRRYERFEVPQSLAMRVNLMYQAEPFETVFIKVAGND